MTREEAVTIIDNLHLIGCGRNQHENDLRINVALDMAIEALQFVKHFDLLKEYQSLQEVVRCKDCKWHKLTNNNETEVCANEQWDISMAVYPIISADDYCSYGERKGGDLE